MDKANALAGELHGTPCCTSLLVRLTWFSALCENYPLQDAKKALDFVGFARRHLSGTPGAFDQFFDALQSLREGQ